MAARAFDYSKWDKIDLSDDEDDFHPNIDNASFIRMKHRSHIERRAQEVAETEALAKGIEENRDRIEAFKERLEQAEDGEDVAKIKQQIAEETEKIEKCKLRVEAIEKSKKLYADDLCHVVSERSVISTSSEKKEELEYEEYTKKYFPILFKYQSIDNKSDESENFIAGNTELLHEHVTGWLLLRCIELEMEGKTADMKRVARQEMLLQYIMDLSQTARQDPRGAVRPFFNRLGEPGVKEEFEVALSQFVEKIRGRAVEKRKEQEAAAKEAEEKEPEYVELSPEERMGPGGLDPVEVFETLPKGLQECFESEDVELLKETLSKMDPEDASYHLKRCIDSGLWVENANK